MIVRWVTRRVEPVQDTGFIGRGPMRKPFDVLIEGLSQNYSRGDRTPVELFLASFHGCEACTQWRIGDKFMEK